MSRRAADAARALAAQVGSFAALATALDALVRGGLVVRAAPVVAAPIAVRPVLWLRAADGRGFAVAVDGVLAGAFAARVLGQEPPDEAAAPREPTPAERGILAFLAAALVEGRALTVAVDAGHAPADALTIEARCELAGARGLVTILVPLDFVRAVPPATADASRIAHVPVTLAVVRGRARVAAARVAALKPRDVVLCADGPLVAVARGGFPCRLHADGTVTVVTIVGPYERGAAMNEALARDLPVELACELGRVTLSAQEVLALAPGAVVTLPAKVGALVELRAGGRVIARGELVDVDGQVGVRISELP